MHYLVEQLIFSSFYQGQPLKLVKHSSNAVGKTANHWLWLSSNFYSCSFFYPEIGQIVICKEVTEKRFGMSNMKKKNVQSDDYSYLACGTMQVL